MKTKKREAKRIKKSVTCVKFTCMVDSELMRKANDARACTWRDILEDAFREVINTESSVRKLKALGE